MDIINKIDSVRASKKISKQDFARKVGICRDSYTAYLTRKRYPSIKVIYQMLDILNLKLFIVDKDNLL